MCVRPVLASSILLRGVVASLCVLAAATACTNPDQHPPRHETAIEISTLRGEQFYLHGQLRIKAELGRRPPGPGVRREARGGEQEGRRRHRGPPPGEEYARTDGERVARITPSHLPPVTLRVRLTNLSSEPLDIRVTDLNSELGNFAVRPDHLALAPGHTADLDPMYSQLGTAAGEFPLTIAVRHGNESDRQTLVLRPEAPPSGQPGG